MDNPTRTCADCGIDISERRTAKRCRPCQRTRELKALKAKKRTIYDHVCEFCGASYRNRVKTARFCSRRCGGRASRPTQQRSACVVCGGRFDGYGRETCSRSCYVWHRKHPSEEPPTQCGRCGVSLDGKPLGTRYCSRACLRAGWAFQTGRTQTRRLIYDSCGICGTDLTGRVRGTRYCSHACQAIKGHERRSRKKSTAPIEAVAASEIFERDNWTCHICDGRIDQTLRNKHPLMASLDHIIPVDDPAYPGHVWENLATAHLRCNISKGPRATQRDWDLYRRRRAQREEGEPWRPRKRVQPQQLLLDVS